MDKGTIKDINHFGDTLYKVHFDYGDMYCSDKELILVNPSQLFITTLEGIMTANIGDYIIRGVKGEFYPCKPDIFEATYEQVDN